MRQEVQLNDSEHVYRKYKKLNDGMAVECQEFAVFLWFFAVGVREYR